MGHLELKSINKGSSSKSHRVKTLEQRWFSEKQRNNNKSGTSEKDELYSDIYV